MHAYAYMAACVVPCGMTGAMRMRKPYQKHKMATTPAVVEGDREGSRAEEQEEDLW